MVVLADQGAHRQDDASFQGLGLNESLLKAVRAAGHTQPTPIQLRAIPPGLAGRDVLGTAQTGTGKTAAFAIPVLQQLGARGRVDGRRRVRALVLTPTRELASQVCESFATYGRYLDMRQAVIFGGVNQNRQVAELDRGVDVLVATPGRLWDLLEQRLVDLSYVEHLVLDEVDRMLDQGFWPTVRRIVRAIPKDRQTLFFSATMPPALKPLVSELLVEPVSVSVAKVSSTPDEIEQHVRFVGEGPEKRAVLAELLSQREVARAIVFTKTKHGANRVVQHLDKVGIRAEAIHGNKSQNARERALNGFRDGDLGVLVATDIAARGLDIDGVSHVINYDLPMDPESYVHRIGRTARAGRRGTAYSLCCSEERPLLARIEKLIGKRIPSAGDHAPTREARDREPRDRHEGGAQRHAREPRESPRLHDGRARQEGRPGRPQQGAQASRPDERRDARPRDGREAPRARDGQQRPREGREGGQRPREARAVDSGRRRG